MIDTEAARRCILDSSSSVHAKIITESDYSLEVG
jgi:hypothetical protein